MATDLNGNIIWYYDPVANNFPSYAQNLEPGGTVMLLGGKTTGVAGGEDTLRQVDLAGDTLRQTDIHAVNAQLAALHRPKILDFDHEAKLLPNGDTVVLGSTQKIVNYKGKPTKFTGDMVIVLDPNFQVTWVWNAFNRLNTNRIVKDLGSPSDWLHANAVSWSPEDDDLIVSLRSPELGDQDRLRRRGRQRPRRLEVGRGWQFPGHRQHTRPVVLRSARRALHQRQHPAGLR